MCERYLRVLSPSQPAPHETLDSTVASDADGLKCGGVRLVHSRCVRVSLGFIRPLRHETLRQDFTGSF